MCWYNPATWFDWLKSKKQSTANNHVKPHIEEFKVDDLNKEVAVQILTSLLAERQSDRKWTWFKRVAISGSSVILFGIYVFSYVSENTSIKVVPNSDLIGVVKIEGPIDGEGMASADKVIPALKKAFESPKVKSVILEINSPGGIPGESERINTVIDQYRETTKKPVLAVITNIGASAAYLIAIHADKIYACNYCLVGSIGAIIHSWDFHRIMEKFDISQRTYASGQLKNMLNPYSSMNDESERKAKDMVNKMAEYFASEVKKSRGNKLLPDINYFTGEAWTGPDAFKIGLVDQIASFEDVVHQNGDIKTFDFGPEPEKKSFIKSLTGSMNAATFNLDDLIKEISRNSGLRFEF